ncbi:hypothetical protein N9W89_02050 [Hellea sp.]|nr:hypothetical protein [Hellea sp.]
MSVKTPEKISTRQALKAAVTDRQVLAMLILGLASGLPYVAVGGTLNAWLTTADVKPVAIGLLSWAFLAYAFKFMWAAALQSRRTPFGLKTGPRRFLMFVLLFLITLGLLALSFSNPPNNLGRIGLISVIIAVLSASFDIVLAAWRIEVARDDTHLDILSTVEQFGYRIASLMGGFVALIVADHIGWKLTFFSGTALMGLTIIGVVIARPSLTTQQHLDSSKNTLRQGKHLSSRQRLVGILLIILGWGIGFYMIANFMHGALTDPENYSARSFIRYQGPWVIGVTVIWLGVVSAVLNWLDNRQSHVKVDAASHLPPLFKILYEAILEPMMELIGRLKWAAILVLAVVLSYRFTDLIWGGFAYPFYLGENYGALGHTLTEVGFASKFMGVIATIVGIALGGLAMLRFGRMPVFFVGAVLAAATNLLFADLALDASFTDAALGFLQLDHLFGFFNLDVRMARLTTVIFAENIAVGLASAASIAYLSSIVNKEYAAVQYALLVSLVMLLGVLGRPTIGAIIEEEGFAKAFILCAVLGGVASILALIEWIRVAKNGQTQT